MQLRPPASVKMTAFCKSWTYQKSHAPCSEPAHAREHARVLLPVAIMPNWSSNIWILSPTLFHSEDIDCNKIVREVTISKNYEEKIHKSVKRDAHINCNIVNIRFISSLELVTRVTSFTSLCKLLFRVWLSYMLLFCT